MMTAFWIMAALLTALAGLLALAGARRGADPDEVVSVSAELAELDRLKSRGLLDEAGWTAARAEAGRRILVSDRELTPVRVGPADRLWVLAALAATAAATLGLYVLVATPGLPDQAYEDRVDLAVVLLAGTEECDAVWSQPVLYGGDGRSGDVLHEAAPITTAFVS